MHLAMWLDPRCVPLVLSVVARIGVGDLSLVPEIASQYDVFHDTTSVVMVQSVDNRILEQERDEAVRRKALALRHAELEAEERAVIIKGRVMDLEERKVHCVHEQNNEQKRKLEIYEASQKSDDTYV